ncbi:hypothetical protein C8A05DRAFT_47543 [Staphylotrichum tortipilum]|uniref:Uncharacterized protein n=1 Tax=Staphylotrichum tortipilum TaxID=2831512 RepID=A0AAN6RPB6_9PEZI|nr:hypothetical protein C8A05DRAFT_47543 [Staphylotrichum longicolle]
MADDGGAGSPNPSSAGTRTRTTTTTTTTSSYATLSFHKSNILRLLSFPDSIPAILEPFLQTRWPPGLEGPRVRFASADEFRLKGSPFGYRHSGEYVGGIRLLRDVLAFLHARGWRLTASLLCSRRYTAKDTLVFRYHPEEVGGLAVEWLGLAPMGSDKLRVVYDAEGVRREQDADPEDQTDTDHDYDHDHDHLGVLIAGVKKTLQGLDYFDKGDWSHDSFEFVLKGKPWRSRGEASVKMRVMLMRLLETMEGYGWKLYATFVQRTSTDEDRILDAWYFVRERERRGSVV